MSGRSPILLGIDLGSSGAKASAIGRDGRVVAQARSEYPISYPRPGWAEQNPEDWFAGACNVIRGCVGSGQFHPQEVVCLAFVGPAHNVAVLDDRGAVLRPTIHWSDVRCVAQADRLAQKAGERIFELSGQPINPSWTLSQLAWINANEPGVWRRMRKLLVTKDYVRHRFTGDYLTDPFDAVGTQLYDLEGKRWSDELCGLIGLDPSLLPRVVPSHHLAGRLLPEIATAVGLPAGTPVAVGGADSSVELLGTGVLTPGQGVVKIGTSSCVNIVTARPVTSRTTLTYPYLVNDLSLALAVTTNGTAAFSWFRKELFPAGTMTFDEIVRLAADSPPGCNGLIFHPYLMGERTPYWDPRLRGAFIGLGPHHHFSDLARAVLEGVAFTVRDCLETLRSNGVPIGELSLLGGGSISPLWSRIAATVLHVELLQPAIDDASVGAAVLAGLPAGLFSSWAEAAMCASSPKRPIRPDDHEGPVYDAYYRVFRECAADIAPHYHSLYDLSVQTDLS